MKIYGYDNKEIIKDLPVRSQPRLCYKSGLTKNVVYFYTQFDK